MELSSEEQLHHALAEAESAANRNLRSLELERLLSPFEQLLESEGAGECASFLLSQLHHLSEAVSFRLMLMAIQEIFDGASVEFVIRAYRNLEQRLTDDTAQSERLQGYLAIAERDIRIVWTDAHVLHASTFLRIGDESLVFATLRLLVVWLEQTGYLPSKVRETLQKVDASSDRCKDLVTYALAYVRKSK